MALARAHAWGLCSGRLPCARRGGQTTLSWATWAPATPQAWPSWPPRRTARMRKQQRKSWAPSLVSPTRRSVRAACRRMGRHLQTRCPAAAVLSRAPRAPAPRAHALHHPVGCPVPDPRWGLAGTHKRGASQQPALAGARPRGCGGHSPDRPGGCIAFASCCPGAGACLLTRSTPRCSTRMPPRVLLPRSPRWQGSAAREAACLAVCACTPFTPQGVPAALQALTWAPPTAVWVSGRTDAWRLSPTTKVMPALAARPPTAGGTHATRPPGLPPPAPRRTAPLPRTHPHPPPTHPPTHPQVTASLPVTWHSRTRSA